MNTTKAEMIAAAQQIRHSRTRWREEPRNCRRPTSNRAFGARPRHTFTPSASLGNAVRVTVRTSHGTGGETPLFFAKVFGKSSMTQEASAVATANPRDIAFVVDLSGSMNDDTDPNNTASINSRYAADGYPTIGTDLLNQVYSDFGYPVTYPTEPKQSIGQPLGVTTLEPAFLGDRPAGECRRFRCNTASSRPIRRRFARRKAYSWTMDVQVPQIMPWRSPLPTALRITVIGTAICRAATVRSAIAATSTS